MPWSSLILIAVVAAASFADARAEPPGAVVRDPGDPKAAAPPARYESAFARYRPNAEAEVGVWRDANDHVGRIGGWRVYGREAIAEPKTDSQSPPASRSESGTGGKPEHVQQHPGTR